MSDIFSSFMAQTASVVLHKKNVAWGWTASLILLRFIPLVQVKWKYEVSPETWSHLTSHYCDDTRAASRCYSLILLQINDRCISHLKLYVIICQRKWDKGSKIHEFKGGELRLRDISLVIIKGCSHTISHHHPRSTAYFVRKCCKLVFYECLLCVNLSHCFLLPSVIFNLLQEVNQTFF